MSALAVWVAGLCGAQLLLQSQAFSPVPVHRLSSVRRIDPRHFTGAFFNPSRHCIDASKAVLFATGSTESNRTASAIPNAVLPKKEPKLIDLTLLVPDLLSVAVACELLGLLDAVNDPTFLLTGGWLQSLPSAPPTTLPLLISRFSINSLLWIVASLSIATWSSPNPKDQEDDNFDASASMASGSAAVKYALQIGAIYAALRSMLGVGLMVVGSSSMVWHATDTWDILRDVYVVLLTTTASRYFVQTMYYR